jgi:putative endonuclease
MSQHNEVGKIGENLAREYLEKEGYKILEQNYRTKYAEIDLVAEKSGGFFGKKSLVFVEVRTKIGENFGSPEDTLNKQKLWKVLQNAKSYSAFKQWDGPARIDAVCIVLSAQGGSALGGKPTYKVERLTHHENIIS